MRNRLSHHFALIVLESSLELQDITLFMQMGGGSKLEPVDLAVGGVIQCVEAATLGMPLEVWKTHMARTHMSNLASLNDIISKKGISGFWAGTSAKMVESFSKGAVLLFSKDAIMRMCDGLGASPIMSAVIGGAGGGVCQTSVMGPCTYLVTAKVTGGESSVLTLVRNTWNKSGLKGFYPGGTAIAFRQATNWASRQGFTDALREQVKKGKPADAKLTKTEEVLCGLGGGALACWNHPFEVARVEAQATAAAGGKSENMLKVMSNVMQKQGVAGLFSGVFPRICLGMWQTLFMVTGARMVKEAMGMP
eukprot:g23156.t1